MINLIKNVLLVLLSINTLFSQFSFADDKSKLNLDPTNATDIHNFRVEFNNVVYSLEHFDSIIKDIERIDETSEKTALSKKAFKDMEARLSTAVDLYLALLKDTSIPYEEWSDYVVRLDGALDSVLFSIIRYHGEDKIDRDSRTVPPHKVVKGVFKEMLLDAKNLFSLRRSADGELVYGPFDRARRNKLSMIYLAKLNEFIGKGLSHLDKEEPARLMLQERMPEMAQMGIDIRKNRIMAQWTTATTYFGFALWGFFLPHIDAIGLMAGRSEMSLDFSADIYAAFWTTIFFAKLATVSGKVLKSLKEIIENSKEPELYGMSKEEKESTIRERVKSLSDSVENDKASHPENSCKSVINNKAS